MARLCAALGERGDDAQTFAAFTPKRWRDAMSSPAGRLRARLEANLLFPLQSLGHALDGPGGQIVPTTNPFFLPLVLVATRPLHGKAVIPLVYDLYPDALEASGMTDPESALAKLGQAANRYWFSRADGVVFIGPRMAEHARERYGEPKRWTILETGARLSEFSRERLGSPEPSTDLERWCAGKVVLSYVGNMGRVHDWETLTAAIPQLLEAHPGAPIGVVIAATGPGAEALRDAWSDLPADRVRFEGPLPDRDWARLLDRTDVALVTLGEGAAETSIPSKAFSAMAARSALAVVAPPRSDVAGIVTRHDCGAAVAPGDVDGLLGALGRAVTDPAWLESCKDAGRQAVAERYDLDVLAQRWQAFCDEVAAGREPGSGYQAAKRTVDVLVSGGVLALTSPVWGGAAVGVRMTMGSPVLFRQKRPGLNGEPFLLAKFRTMRDPKPGEEGPDSDGKRITRLGAFMRKTSIDELPTLLNVLKGDMTLVGPRPLLMRYLPRYSERQSRRHEAPPGVTGWAQVRGRNSISWEEKFEKDVWYVENRSLLLDLRILLETAGKVFAQSDISQEGHATMPEFMGAAVGSEAPA